MPQTLHTALAAQQRDGKEISNDHGQAIETNLEISDIYMQGQFCHNKKHRQHAH